MPQEAFQTKGFVAIPSVLGETACHALLSRLQSTGRPGARRLLAEPWCAALAETLRRHPAIAAIVPRGHVGVQCTYFEKSAETNWLVPLHQDLSIPVAERVEAADLTGWARKDGVTHVQPPVELLRELVALRCHLDDCGAADGPLRVVPGSHRLGRLDADAARAVRDATGETTCLGARGSVLAMRPLLLHASSKARGHSRRRVLHFLFGPASLPHGLAWPLTGG